MDELGVVEKTTTIEKPTYICRPLTLCTTGIVVNLRKYKLNIESEEIQEIVENGFDKKEES